MQRINIILLHGTFAVGAPWASKTESSFRNGVAEKLTGYDVYFYAPEWPGRIRLLNNDFGSRLRGSKVVEDLVLRLHAENPDVPIFIASHSHGGSVAGYAMRNEAVERAVRGVICMPTKFLVPESRPFWPILVTLVAAGPFAAGYAILGRRLLLDTELATGAFFPMLALAAIIGIVVASSKQQIEAYSKARAEQLRVAIINPSKLLVLGSEGDEVAVAFSIVNFLTHFPSFFARTTFLSFIYLIALPFSAVWAWKWKSILGDDHPGWTARLATAVLIPAAIVAGLFALVGIITPIIEFAIKSLAFGYIRPWDPI